MSTEPKIELHEILPKLARVTINDIDMCRSIIESLPVDVGDGLGYKLIARLNTGRQYTYYAWTDDVGDPQLSCDPLMGHPVTAHAEWEFLAMHKGGLCVLIPASACEPPEGSAALPNAWIFEDAR